MKPKLNVTATCMSTNGSQTLTIVENRGRVSKETKLRLLNDVQPTKIILFSNQLRYCGLNFSVLLFPAFCFYSNI